MPSLHGTYCDPIFHRQFILDDSSYTAATAPTYDHKPNSNVKQCPTFTTGSVFDVAFTTYLPTAAHPAAPHTGRTSFPLPLGAVAAVAVARQADGSHDGRALAIHLCHTRVLHAARLWAKRAEERRVT